MATKKKKAAKKKATKKKAAKKKATKKKATKKKAAASSSSAAKTLKPLLLHAFTTRAACERMEESERPFFLKAVEGIYGNKKKPLTFARAIEILAEQQQGLFAILLTRGGEGVYDVWINAVMDDGVVFESGNVDGLTGIGISQTRVYGMTAEDGEDECQAISDALYRSGLKLPDFSEF